MDYESRSSYSFSVEVLNPIVDPRFLRRGPFKDRASIRVAVLDADEPPRFSRARYHMDVSENCPPACTVGRVSAVDPDTGLTNNIRYSNRPEGMKTGVKVFSACSSYNLVVSTDNPTMSEFICNPSMLYRFRVRVRG